MCWENKDLQWAQWPDLHTGALWLESQVTAGGGFGMEPEGGGSCPLRSWNWNLWVVRSRELFPTGERH